jgi:hypothetical protein
MTQQGMTEQQQQPDENTHRRLAALENICNVREAILAKRGGKPFEINVVELIREMREERVEHILNTLNSLSPESDQQ